MDSPVFNPQGLIIPLTGYVHDAFNPEPLMPAVGQVLISSIEENFMQRGRYLRVGSFEGGDTKWEPLKNKLSDNRRGADGKFIKGARRRTILQNTGALARGFEPQTSKNSVTITNMVPYFEVHQFGKTINHPGGTPYIVVGGKARFLKKDGEYPDGVQFTKPHQITIPARPMLVVQEEDIMEIVSMMVKRAEEAKRS